jgi:lipid A 4'-phosphatase
MRSILALLAAMAAASALFLLWPGLDLWASGLFYRPGRDFALRWEPVSGAIHDAIPLLMGVVIFAVLLLLAWDLRRGLRRGKALARAAFVALSFLIGPGLVANTLLKDNWGRPRPWQVTAFGGASRFAPPVLVGDQCPNNCSFVAGDAAAAFAFLAFALLLPAGRARRIGVAAALAFGTAIGLMRVAQGAHFLSDVVFAGLVVSLVVLVLRRLLLPERAPG